MSKKKGLRCFPFFYFSTKCHLSSICDIKIPQSSAIVFLKGPESFRGPFGKNLRIEIFKLSHFQIFKLRKSFIFHLSSTAALKYRAPLLMFFTKAKAVWKNSFHETSFLFASFILSIFHLSFTQNASINLLACFILSAAWLLI